jgi:hypothetical protein
LKADLSVAAFVVQKLIKQNEVKPIKSGIRKSIVIFIDNENIITGKKEKLI